MQDEELIESLRLWNRDDAADRIEALVKERDKAALWATEQHACADNYALRLGQEKARAERLAELLDRAVNGPWLDGDLERARAALTQKDRTDAE